MKIAVISDIHGNAFALDALLADLKGDTVDQIVCLGDAIQGGPQPAQTVAMLRELACPVVMGNADAWLLSGVETGNQPMTEARKLKLDTIREWSLAQLSEADRAFISGFQPTVELSLDGSRNLLCFHGSPTSFDDLLFPTTPEEEFQGFLAAYLPNLMTGGHTHLPHVRRIGASDSFFFNPGSVGLVWSHAQDAANFHTDPWAEYAILTAEHGRLRLEFRRAYYDVQTLIEIYRASGRPYTQDSIKEYGGLANSA